MIISLPSLQKNFHMMNLNILRFNDCIGLKRVLSNSCHGCAGDDVHWLRLPLANFGTKRVTQKRKEKPTNKEWKDGTFSSRDALPKSLLCNSAIRKLVYSNTVEAEKLANKVDWNSYKCDVKGVRWHPSGSWYVQFNRRNYEKNFFVNCHCYFSVEEHGFEEAKRKAIEYRKRLEAEYEELQEAWKQIDRKRFEEGLDRRNRLYNENLEKEFLIGDSEVT